MDNGDGGVAIILNTASYERVNYALTIAKVSAAFGREVHVLFSHGGLVRLMKGRIDELGDETPPWLRGDVEAGLKKGSIGRISEQLRDLKALGGRIYACPSAMAFHNATIGDLIGEVDGVYGIAAFLGEIAREASMTLYV